MTIPVKIPELKSYTREELSKMSVMSLRQLIKKHNLHTTYIKGYSRMKKDTLVNEFLKHYKKSNQKRVSSKTEMMGYSKSQNSRVKMLKNEETRVKARIGASKNYGNLRRERR